ncbi:sigma-54 interaction domain-containing protein [Candidatus Chrysopegis kryptomonas]|uniref:Regulatory protein, Fis family n=1 Tax=Candidatus Chryseopegocella kryptomonas TaxID=1633643 RepID=A0A0P1NZP7_9BACT|nr:sigma-54 dependent transcriptional regulator [Candidatus Chrysopegis kryptomonas]CUT04549.1 regulatory protein, Fis family [Candidatus Chrysopegis kryptomonas]
MNIVIGSLKNIFDDALIAASTDEPVLILGETGTGKEVLARYIHQNSNRKDKIFIPINCAAIPPNLLESELFGYKKGAFTGADRDKKGILEEANGGTVFLDEIGELPIESQVKILRAIEEKEIISVGDTKPKQIDVRFIASTNVDLKAKVEKGEFRKDLYYRLSVFVYKLPPLRDRIYDLPEFVKYFIQSSGKDVKIDSAVMELFFCYPWPGNIRELRSVLVYAIAKSSGDKIQVEHLPDYLIHFCKHPEILRGNNAREKLECFEAYLISETLKEHPEPKEAARFLGISLRTFYRKLKKYRILPK